MGGLCWPLGSFLLSLVPQCPLGQTRGIFPLHRTAFVNHVEPVIHQPSRGIRTRLPAELLS